jgi:hypothetical protein
VYNCLPEDERSLTKVHCVGLSCVIILQYVVKKTFKNWALKNEFF